MTNFFFGLVRNIALLVASLLSWPAFAQTVTYFHNDMSGTPAAATDAAGNLLWKESYRPFGEKLYKQSASSANSIGFHGRPFDDGSGLSYMGARYYDPVLGRFLSVDPQGVNPGDLHSFNRYAFANNNPYKFVDPDGHTPLDVVFLVYDVGKLGVAVYTGIGVGAAAVDVAVSTVGVFSPIPGLRVLRSTEKAVETARAAEHGAEAARNAERGAESANIGKRETGSYTNHHESGRTYDGKGDRERSQESARRIERETGDKHVATEWTPAKSDREAFKDESRRLDSHGGPKSDSNYNKIESPGKRMREQDERRGSAGGV